MLDLSSTIVRGILPDLRSRTATARVAEGILSRSLHESNLPIYHREPGDVVRVFRGGLAAAATEFDAGGDRETAATLRRAAERLERAATELLPPGSSCPENAPRWKTMRQRRAP